MTEAGDRVFGMLAAGLGVASRTRSKHSTPAPKGEAHHKVKLSDADVALIRELHEEFGLGYRALGTKFGVSRQTIRSIVTYRTRPALPDVV